MEMNTRRLLGIALLVVPLAACGGHKRPPVVSGAPTRPTASPNDRGTVPSQAPLPVETGPDVQPIDSDVARGEDFTVSDPETGEGGPIEDIHFEYDQATLTDQARAILDRHAGWLKAHPSAKVMIEGHCDERGTVEYNLALGDRRARAAHEYLVGVGVPAAMLRTTSYGKERPLDPGSNEAAWAKNRRAHFTVSR
jgi:peptidoglycan-associated lipoprotein